MPNASRSLPAQLSGTAYLLPASKVAASLHVDPALGLTEAEVEKRREHYGYNTIDRPTENSTLRLFIDRFRDPLIVILGIAALASLGLRQYADALIIAVTIAADVALSFLQVWRTERALERIRQQIHQTVLVRRNGVSKRISAEELVIGDSIELRAGEKVPADARLTKANGLFVQEAALTGESDDVEKRTSRLLSRSPLADRVCMLFMGTTIANGTGEALVTATGTYTEYGRIAQLLKTETSPPSPLRRKLKRTSIDIGWLVIGAVGLLAVIDVFRRTPLPEAVRTALALIVSAIPEDLTMMLTIALTVGAVRILRKKGVVRQLGAVETLGAATVICTDKTGTLTKGEMQAQAFDLLQGTVLSSNQLARRSLPAALSLGSKGGEGGPPREPIEILALTALCLASDARRLSSNSNDYVGSPTERTALQFAESLGMHQEKLRHEWRLLDSIAFSSHWKYRATLHSHPRQASRVVFVNGAPDVLLHRSTHTVSPSGTFEALTDERRLELKHAMTARAARGERLLGVAVRRHFQNTHVRHSDIKDLSFLGILAITDPIRPEVVEALRHTQSAGVVVKLVTGDHETTAVAVARACGLTVTHEAVCNGEQLADMTDHELKKRLATTVVFSRVTPLDKERIVRLLQGQGHVVAMTGDGVNDAVALKGADIGVAMGSGKDIAKDAADLVLLDDNFATIVSAIREGRVVRDNIRKVISFLLATNAAEVPLFFSSLLLGLPLPLLPAQLLWINLIIGGTADIALSLERDERNVMQRAPEKQSGALFSRHQVGHFLFAGAIMMVSTLTLYWYLLTRLNVELIYARSMAFAFLSLASVLSTWSWRSLNDSLFTRRPGNRNVWIPVSVAASLSLLLAALYIPALQRLFKTVPLSREDWVLMIILAIVTVIIIDLRKLLLRARPHVPLTI